MKNKITFCCSTYNTLNYLKLAIKSVRQNAYFKDAPFVVHTENSDDGTNEWLEENKDKYNLEIYIEPHTDPVRGIGGGMNFCAEKVKTEYILFIQSDFYCARNFDIELLKVFDDYDEDTKLLVTSHRVQPDIFHDRERARVNNKHTRPGTIFTDFDDFGVLHDDFKEERFLNWCDEFSEMNDFRIRRSEGAGGYLIKKRDWDYIGGNDPLFAPASWEDMDLAVRMQLEDFEFVLTSKSVIWHFAARTSWFEGSDDIFFLDQETRKYDLRKSKRQVNAEARNRKKFSEKWGRIPDYDEFDMPKIESLNTEGVKTRL
jgi:GT2 family glycosyltransferase